MKFSRYLEVKQQEKYLGMFYRRILGKTKIDSNNPSDSTTNTSRTSKKTKKIKSEIKQEKKQEAINKWKKKD